MSNYYDPWAHAVRLFVNRLVLFVVLSVLLGLAAWAAVLHWAFEADGMAIVRSTWAMSSTSDMRWCVIAGQCAVIGVLLPTTRRCWIRR